MDWWIDFAKGPLFAITFLIMVLGLARHVIIQIYYLFFAKGARLKNVPWNKMFKDMATWVVPVGHLIKGTRFFSVCSFVFHLALILVAVFLVDHIVLWENLIGVSLPSIGRVVADWLTVITIICILGLLFFRIFVPRSRAMSRPIDYIVLIAILLPVVFGFMAGHPGWNPFTWELSMLLHILTGEFVLILIPFTKLAHIVLYFFDRLSPIHWQLKPGAGDKVAHALFGKEAKV
jgi:nitrate reductase gamma subunit